ncbi:hypothetical protein NAEX_06624 [Nannocystis exedens]|nr:hypothetical protein NAEX_06624 [Nannocystis exedens]
MYTAPTPEPVMSCCEASAATQIDGAPWNDLANDAGAVYVFSRQGQAWMA